MALKSEEASVNQVLHQKGGHLSFPCTGCSQDVPLVLFGLEKKGVTCQHCSQRYDIDDGNLLRQLSKFEALCRQIHASEEILSDTAIGVDVGGHQVQIPFRLLLTRFNANLKLQFGDKEVAIRFQLEPMQQSLSTN